MSHERHPPLQPGWIDRPHQVFALDEFGLESGESIRGFRLTYVVHGALDLARANAVLVPVSIGGTHHRLDPWIGPGRALDPEHRCIICVDAIGNGLSSSPGNSEAQPGLSFPRFTIRDMVESQRRLLQHLGIDRLDAVVGASMGGMQALQWGVSRADAMCRIVAMVPMARAAPWSVAVNEAARRCLMADPRWLEGDPAAGWLAWTAVMQVLAARTPAAVARAFPDAASVTPWIAQRAQFFRRANFSAVDWIYQTWAYDAHDVGTTPGFDGDTDRALRSIRAPTLILAAPLDLYNPVEEARAAAHAIPGARYLEIPSLEGHHAASGASAGDVEFIDRAMREFFAG